MTKHADGRARTKKPDGYWEPFNTWWRALFDHTGERASAVEMREWFALNAHLVWPPEDMPTIRAMLQQGKGMRSLPKVREFSKTNRLSRKAAKLNATSGGGIKKAAHGGASPMRPGTFMAAVLAAAGATEEALHQQQLPRTDELPRNAPLAGSVAAGADAAIAAVAAPSQLPQLQHQAQQQQQEQQVERQQQQRHRAENPLRELVPNGRPLCVVPSPSKAVPRPKYRATREASSGGAPAVVAVAGQSLPQRHTAGAASATGVTGPGQAQQHGLSQPPYMAPRACKQQRLEVQRCVQAGGDGGMRAAWPQPQQLQPPPQQQQEQQQEYGFAHSAVLVYGHPFAPAAYAPSYGHTLPPPCSSVYGGMASYEQYGPLGMCSREQQAPVAGIAFVAAASCQHPHHQQQHWQHWQQPQQPAQQHQECPQGAPASSPAPSAEASLAQRQSDERWSWDTPAMPLGRGSSGGGGATDTIANPYATPSRPAGRAGFQPLGFEVSPGADPGMLRYFKPLDGDNSLNNSPTDALQLSQELTASESPLRELWW